MAKQALLQGLSLGSAVTGLLSGIQANSAARKSVEYRLRGAKLSADSLNFQAYQTEQLGGLKAAQQAGEAVKTAGMQTLATALNGGDISSGVAQNLINGTLSLGEMDAASIQHAATRQAMGLKAEAVGVMAEANADAARYVSQGANSLLTAGLKAGQQISQLQLGGGDSSPNTPDMSEFKVPSQKTFDPENV